MAETLKVDSGYGIPMYARLRVEGDKWGREGCLTHEGEPIIEFYDGRYDHEEWLHPEGIHGQFTGGSYYLSTFNEHDADYGLALQDGVDNWTLSASAVQTVKEWVKEIMGNKGGDNG
jgi:hypothetical protein